MSQLTVENGAKLLPDVPKGTGGTKSKSKDRQTDRRHTDQKTEKRSQ